jgi:hypothetical protein
MQKGSATRGTSIGVRSDQFLSDLHKFNSRVKGSNVPHIDMVSDSVLEEAKTFSRDEVIAFGRQAYGGFDQVLGSELNRMQMILKCSGQWALRSVSRLRMCLVCRLQIKYLHALILLRS